PGVPMQRVLDRVDRRHVSGVAVEHSAYHFYDSGEGKFSGQKALDGDLVRRVEHRGRRAAGAQRLIRELHRRKTMRIDGKKLERADLRQIETSKRCDDALGIEQR